MISLLEIGIDYLAGKKSANCQIPSCSLDFLGSFFPASGVAVFAKKIGTSSILNPTGAACQRQCRYSLSTYLTLYTRSQRLMTIVFVEISRNLNCFIVARSTSQKAQANRFAAISCESPRFRSTLATALVVLLP